jgi:polyisoprenoid-binding protein YceI
MKKILMILGVLVLLSNTSFSQLYVCENGKARFYSETPVENIEGISNSVISAINIANNQVQYKIPMTSFVFKWALMQDHFNENYVESGKYPYATFKGKINESIDWTKDGSYDISATGVLNIHGIDKTITEKGTLIISKGVVTIKNSFSVMLSDYNVEIPNLVKDKIRERQDITVDCTYKPYVKK